MELNYSEILSHHSTEILFKNTSYLYIAYSNALFSMPALTYYTYIHVYTYTHAWVHTHINIYIYTYIFTVYFWSTFDIPPYYWPLLRIPSGSWLVASVFFFFYWGIQALVFGFLISLLLWVCAVLRLSASYRNTV